MKAAYLDSINLTRDINLESQNISLKIKQDLYGDFQAMKKKQLDLEKIS